MVLSFLGPIATGRLTSGDDGFLQPREEVSPRHRGKGSGIENPMGLY